MAYATTALIRLKSGLTTAEVSDSDLSSIIPLADEELEQTTGQKFDNGETVTEYYSLYPPKRADDILPNRIVLGHYPVQSVTSFQIVNYTECAYVNLDTLSVAEISGKIFQSADYYCDAPNGIIELSTRAFDFVPNRAKITYTYGHATTPTIVTEIASNMAAIRAWVNFLGGNYNRLNNYTVPEQTYDKGDFYDRGTKIIEQLRMNTSDLLDQLARKQSAQFSATNGGFY